MAGPGASILLPDSLSEVRATEVRAEILRTAEKVEGNDFWIDGRPFIVWFGEEYPGELDELCEVGLPDVLGWKPNATLGFAAMCNGQEDHRILAELCVLFGRKLDGIIDLGGRIAVGPSFDGLSATQPVRIETPDNLQGVLFATSYLTAMGVYATCHFADTTLMESWLKDSRFRMVK